MVENYTAAEISVESLLPSRSNAVACASNLRLRMYAPEAHHVLKVCALVDDQGRREVIAVGVLVPDTNE